MRGCSLCCAVVLLLAGLSRGQTDSRQSLPKPEPLRLSRTEDGFTATLLYREKPGLLSLEVAGRDQEARDSLSMDARIRLWKPLIEEFLSRPGRKREYLLSVGRYPELASRLASAAVCSGNWNQKTGRTRSGKPDSAVREWIASQHLAGEMERLFAPLGFQLAVHSVEHVMLCRGRELRPDPAASCHPEFDAAGELPCGASILFRLSPSQ